MIVLDASAMVELVPRTEKGLRIAERIADDEGPFVAPHLIECEVLNALRELVRVEEIDLAVAGAAPALFGRFPLRRHDHDVLRSRVWELRDNLSAYDATYVAAAEMCGCPLITCDGPLSRAPGHRATIELF